MKVLILYLFSLLLLNAKTTCPPSLQGKGLVKKVSQLTSEFKKLLPTAKSVITIAMKDIRLGTDDTAILKRKILCSPILPLADSVGEEIMQNKHTCPKDFYPLS